ncbi:MAG: Holliday junction resolvase RuvX [Magnetospiraceae bacterium]
MAVITLEELSTLLGRHQRLLALDLGTKTIGLALSDVSRFIATPVETLKRTKFTKDAKALFEIVTAQDVGALVLGLPISMDGTEGPRCQSTRQFAENLLGLQDIPILLWDERLSTAAVERILIHDADLSRSKRSAVVDRAAAAYILQGVLDALGHSR